MTYILEESRVIYQSKDGKEEKDNIPVFTDGLPCIPGAAVRIL